MARCNVSFSIYSNNLSWWNLFNSWMSDLICYHSNVFCRYVDCLTNFVDCDGIVVGADVPSHACNCLSMWVHVGAGATVLLLIGWSLAPPIAWSDIVEQLSACVLSSVTNKSKCWLHLPSSRHFLVAWLLGNSCWQTFNDALTFLGDDKLGN